MIKSKLEFNPAARRLVSIRTAIIRLVKSLPRIPISQWKRPGQTRESGVYVFYNEKGQVIRIGRSDHVVRRVAYQVKKVIDDVRGLAAEARGIKSRLACPHCKDGWVENPEFDEFKKTVVVKLFVAVLSREELDSIHLTIREAEGFLLWAMRPPISPRFTLTADRHENALYFGALL
jgi:hypothetical protein